MAGLPSFDFKFLPLNSVWKSDYFLKNYRKIVSVQGLRLGSVPCSQNDCETLYADITLLESACNYNARYSLPIHVKSTNDYISWNTNENNY
jgi:hypothetical protein